MSFCRWAYLHKQCDQSASYTSRDLIMPPISSLLSYHHGSCFGSLSLLRPCSTNNLLWGRKVERVTLLWVSSGLFGERPIRWRCWGSQSRVRHAKISASSSTVGYQSLRLSVHLWSRTRCCSRATRYHGSAEGWKSTSERLAKATSARTRSCLEHCPIVVGQGTIRRQHPSDACFWCAELSDWSSSFDRHPT